MEQSEKSKLQQNVDEIRENSSEQSPTPQADILEAITGNKKQQNTHLIEREPIIGTPFYAVGSEQEGYILTYGKYKISENFKSKQLLINWMNNNDWKIVEQMILCTLEHNHLFKKN